MPERIWRTVDAETLELVGYPIQIKRLKIEDDLSSRFEVVESGKYPRSLKVHTLGYGKHEADRWADEIDAFKAEGDRVP